MKKSISILSLLAACSALAGESSPINVVEPAIIPPAEKKTLTLTVQGGIMHMEASNASLASTYAFSLPEEIRDTNSQMVPSALYGFTITAEKNLTEPGQKRYFHSVGLSVGYYSGSESGTFTSCEDPDDPTGLFDTSIMSSSTDVTVDMIPIILAYNLQYEATESLYFYAGIRGGVIIRNTDATGHASYEDTSSILPQEDHEYFNDSSTKVLPTLGLGIGMRAYMTEKLAFDLSYDFGWTFGDDCDDIIGSEGSVLPGTSESGRYYGTLKAGVSYSF